MKKRLTVTIDEEAIRVAKEYVENNDRTLSDLAENYFHMLRVALRNERRAELEEMPPLTRALIRTLEEHDGKEYLRYLDEHYR